MTRGERWQEVTKAEPCPICEKPDWCRRSPDGAKVACRRESRGAVKAKRYKDGSEAHIHILRDDRQADGNGKPKNEERGADPPLERAPPPTSDAQQALDKRDQAYRLLLTELPLSPDHRDNLRQRGLSDAEIDEGQYRTLPSYRQKFVKRLADGLGAEFTTVPGFIEGDRGPRIAAPSGLVVPVRDPVGRVVALKVRPDKPNGSGKYCYLSSAKYGGPSPGSPAHVPLGVCGPCPVVRVTEGELKADIATRLSGVPTVSFSGVASWRSVVPLLQTLGAKTVQVAFDADAPTNRHVAKALRDCVEELLTLGYAIELERWPIDAGKGIDDVYAAGKADAVDVVTGDVALQAAEEIARAAGVAAANLSDTLDGSGCPYFANQTGTYWLKSRGDHNSTVQLANFSARIVGDIVRDDGAEQMHLFELEAEYRGRRTRFTEAASRFVGMNWPVERLGATAILQPGPGIRERLRVAIQMLSGDVPRREVFCHLGWRKVGGRWVYLHAAGAVGPDGPVTGIEVDLPNSLSRYALPAPPRGPELTNAVLASLKILDLGPDPLTCSLQGAVYRSVLGPADFSVHLCGETGTGKSERAALAQQHFGPEMRNKHLPANWSSTANSLEALAFCAKDALLTVDDFAPCGSATDVTRYHKDADRLFRAQGNRSGRGRQRPDGTLRPDKAPRGLILSTGEDVPRGHSVQSRCLILELERGEENHLKLLTPFQQDAANGLYAAAMAAFLRWLARRYEDVQAEFPQRLTELRSQAYSASAHPRTPEIVANLAYGWELFLRFAREEHVLSEADSQAIWQRVWKALNAASETQASHQASADPVIRFGELLSSAMASGHAHVAGPDGNLPESPGAWGWRHRTVGTGDYERPDWQPCGDRIGWYEDGQLYLEGEAAYGVAQKQGGHSHGIPVQPRTLHKRLWERGLLATREEPRLTVRRSLEGRRRHVLHVRHETLLSQKVGQVGQADLDAEKYEDSGPLSWPTSAGNAQELDQRSEPVDTDKHGRSVGTGSLGTLGPVSEVCTSNLDADDFGEL